MKQEWLANGERLLGWWSVYTGGQGPLAAKVPGKLYITEGTLHFEPLCALRENAATDISQGIKAFELSAEPITVNVAEIASVKTVREFVILRSLEITLQSGHPLVFHFGAMSPKSAAKILASRGVAVA